MKWLIVAVILAAIVLRVWGAIFPRSTAGRMLRSTRQRRDRLDAIPAKRLFRSSLLFAAFAALAGALAVGLRIAGAHVAWLDLDTPFFGALAGGLIAVGLLSLLVGIFLVAWVIVKKMSRN